MVLETTYDRLAKHPFLAGLTRHQLDRLSYWGHGALLHSDARVFDEGTRADRFWLILEGHVRLDTHLPGHGDVTVDRLGPGTVLGWSWLFPPYRWNFAATATELTHVVVMDGPGIRELCDRDPVLGLELHRRFMRVVVDRLQHTRQRLIEAYASESDSATA
jgi:CRP/FNR family transcriptional regulator, cyclic AMP receptor protein